MQGVCTSIHRVTKTVDMPRSIVQNIVRNILRHYAYKLQLVQKLLPYDFETRFSLQFFASLEVDSDWLWNILWTDKADFYLDGSVNTSNCRIWEPENPCPTLHVPLQSLKITVWCGFNSSSFIFGPYFLRN